MVDVEQLVLTPEEDKAAGKVLMGVSTGRLPLSALDELVGRQDLANAVAQARRCGEQIAAKDKAKREEWEAFLASRKQVNFRRRIGGKRPSSFLPETRQDDARQEDILVEDRQPEDQTASEERGALVRVDDPVRLLALLNSKEDVEVIQEAVALLVNQKHGVIGNVGGKCRVLDWVPDEVDEGLLIPTFQSFDDFRNRYMNYPVPIHSWGKNNQYYRGSMPLGKFWLQHTNRAQYQGVQFVPGAPAILKGDRLNLWRGWGLVPKKGDWSKLQRHIENVLAGGDRRGFEYIINWHAYGYQHPAEPAETSLVFRGPEGSGKGILGRGVRRTWGVHGYQISQPRHLTGNFNAHLWTCCYLFADEAFWAGDKQHEGILKALISEDTLMIEKKGIDQIKARNFLKLTMASNEDWVIPARENARRFGMFDVDNRYAYGVAPEEERLAYFDPLVAEMGNGGLEAMLWDLLGMNLGSWHPRQVYNTAALMRQKKESLRGNKKCFEGLLQAGTLPHGDFAWTHPPNCALTEQLLDYFQKDRWNMYLSDETLAGFLTEKGCQNWRVPGKGTRGWRFPPLAEARQAWEAEFGGSWPWREALKDWRL
jgi:Mesyanzhinovviridae DNA primase